MGRLPGAVIARNHDAAVFGKSGENGERGGAVEAVIRIDVRHVRIDLGIGRHLEVAVDTEYLPDRHLHVGQTGGLLRFGHGGGRHQSSEVSGAPETRFCEYGCGWVLGETYQRATGGRSPRPNQSSVVLSSR